MKQIRLNQILLFVMAISFIGCSKQELLFKLPKDFEKGKEVVSIYNQQNTDRKVKEHRAVIGDIINVRLLNTQDLDAGTTGQQQVKELGTDYTIAEDSSATFPTIGKVNLVGLTRAELITKLKKEYAKYIKNPMLDVEFTTVTVNVLGEFKRPGKYPIREGTTTLIDMISVAGGFGPQAKRKEVHIIRGELSNSEVIILDLTNIEALKSDEIWLRDKDIIYVAPRDVKQFNNTVRPYTFLTSVIASAVTVFVVISRNNR